MKSITRNYLFNAGYQILSLITPLITTPYVSRVLGPEGIGQISFTQSIVSYFTLFATLGVTLYGQREIAYVQDSLEKRSEVFWNTKLLQCCISIPVLILYLLFAAFFGNGILYVIFALNIVNVIIDITWFFQGMEEFEKTVIRNTVFKILNIAYIFIFVREKEDVALYALGLVLFILLGNISLWLYLPQYVKKIPIKELRPFRNFRTVLSLFIPTIAIQIYTVLDKTMIGAISRNAFENGYYEQALKISSIVLTLVTALGTVMMPRIGFLYEQKRKDEVDRVMYRGYRFVWFLGVPLCLGLVSVSSNFVPWFFGAEFAKVALLLKILAFLILAIGINNVTGVQYLITTRRQNIFTRTVIIGACVNVVLNSILIPLFSSVGAAIASVAAETTIAVVQLMIVRKELDPKRILKEGIHYFIAGACMVAVLLIVSARLTPSIVHTFVLVAVGAAIYFCVLLLLKDEFFISNLEKVTLKILNRG